VTTDGTAEAEPTNGTAEAEPTNGTAEAVTTDGTAEAPTTDGTAEAVTTNEGAEAVTTDGGAEAVTTNRTAEADTTNGTAEAVTTSRRSRDCGPARETAPRQRLRIVFAKGEPIKYISHLDLTRAWERAFRRAALPIAHSQGFHPRPRFQIAAALPVGVTSRAERMDLWLVQPLSPEEALTRLRPVLPLGLEVLEASEVDLQAPALQSQVRAADYCSRIVSQEPTEALCARVRALLEAPTLLRQRQHKGKPQLYDLRPLILSLALEPGPGGSHLLRMQLQASPQGAGRPGDVLDALGLSLATHTVERTKLHFAFDK
jgi:radical SAM-linked protein